METLYAWLIEKSLRIKFYTFLSDVFRGMPNLIEDYDWLFSDYECNYYPSPLKLNQDVFVTGRELKRILSEDEPQMIWGIISSVPIGRRFDVANNPVWSDGNPDLWKRDVNIQNQGSEIEITCWDSNLFIFMTTQDEVNEKFLSSFPEAIDLRKYNEQNEKKSNP